jgi:hypothetical protein
MRKSQLPFPKEAAIPCCAGVCPKEHHLALLIHLKRPKKCKQCVNNVEHELETKCLRKSYAFCLQNQPQTPLYSPVDVTTTGTARYNGASKPVTQRFAHGSPRSGRTVLPAHAHCNAPQPPPATLLFLHARVSQLHKAIMRPLHIPVLGRWRCRGVVGCGGG